MVNGRVNIGSIRREQVVEAAVAIISEHGIQNLSLSAIEKRTGMSRGHLTYYFPTKEDILLAVFDQMVETMRQRVGVSDCPDVATGGWAGTHYLLRMVLTMPPINRTFGPLLYTFLAQMHHRPDFRDRLARLYGEWRDHLAAGLGRDLAKNGEHPSTHSPQVIATVIQALLHGLSMQRAVYPDELDGNELVDFCLNLLGTFLGLPTPPPESSSLELPAREVSPPNLSRP